MKYSTVFFDFGFVLCHDYYYKKLIHTHPHVFQFVQEQVFGSDRQLLDKWVRGAVDSDYVNRFISAKTGIDYDELSDLFEKSIKSMKMDERMIEMAERIKASQKKIALVTDNMDIFNRVIVKHYNLDRVFPVIISSADYGHLKADEGGQLFDIAMKQVGEGDYSRTLLVDDRENIRAAFERKGGASFSFTTFEDFEPWARKYLGV